MSATAKTRKISKGYKGLGMEGGVARWYARTTGNSLEQFRKEARAVAGRLAEGASVLEVAPGLGTWRSSLRSWALPGRGSRYQQDVRRARN